MFNISARNQFAGAVEAVHPGKVNGIVLIKSGELEITADITMGSIERLGLAEGKPATAIIKATSVMVAEGGLDISARNQFAGTVKSVEEGAVNAIVTIDCSGQEVVADITMGSVKRMGLFPGKAVTAVVKATEVMVGVE